MAGLFCMSGLVAHADDDDDDDNENHTAFSQIQQAALFQPKHFHSKKASTLSRECNLKEEARKCHGNVEFLTQHYCPCCVKYHCSDGTCRMVWPSGSTYRGEVSDGNLHGVGTFTGADGTFYEGNWIMNQKHGFGRKKYANGDVYEGFWKWDVPEGQGLYSWSDGSEYRGDWRNGLMCGLGILTWAGGDSYDGEWVNGLAGGQGVYTWADGSTYAGYWRKGLKSGTGLFYLPARKAVELISASETISVECEAIAGHEQNCYYPLNNPKTLSDKELTDKLTVDMATSTGDIATSTGDRDQDLNIALEMHCRLKYSHGNFVSYSPVKGNPLDLMDERRSSAFCSEHTLGLTSWTNDGSGQESLKHLESPGEVIVKGHRSYDLVMSLQLGIRYSVSEATPGQTRRLFRTDFGSKAMVKVNLLKEGSQLKAHLDMADFKWIDYCPTVFRHLRDLCKVSPSDYLQSICGGGLRELPSPGKSGCLFYVSQDQRFMIKTLRKAEVKSLLRMLPRYCNHMHMYTESLLTKFYGLHSLKLAGSRKVHFVVMGNVFSSKTKVHRIYDLKGSSEGRIANKRGSIAFAPLKDLDLDAVFKLDPCSRHTLLEQVDKDCKFLESEHIMDYSLLLGLHFKELNESSSSQEHFATVDLPSRLNFAVQEENFPNENSTLQGRRSCERASPEREIEVSQSALGNESGNMHVMAKMSARTPQGPPKCVSDNLCSQVSEVMLQFGIIDILQEYDFSKRLEHAYKSIYFDPTTISAVDPMSYSARFQHFLHQVLIENR